MPARTKQVRKLKKGDPYPVWWNTGSEYINGWYTAKIIDIKPYKGAYPQYFTHVLQLTNPGTRRGWTEMAVKQ